MAKLRPDPKLDQDITEYVDALMQGQPASKDSIMEIRELQNVADSLHELTHTYAPPSRSATQRRMEVFGAYRQSIRSGAAGDSISWVERIFRGDLRGRALAGAVFTILLLVTAGVLLSPAGGGISAAAGLGDWLIPLLALGLAAVLFGYLAFTRRK